MISSTALAALIRRAIQTSTTTWPGLGGVTLDAYLGGRVVPAAYLDADAATLERPCLVVDAARGGSADYTGSVQTSTVDIYGYSDDSSGVASEIYDAAFAILQGTRLADPDGNVTLSGYLRENQRPRCGRNEAMKSFFAFGTWTAYTAG